MYEIRGNQLVWDKQYFLLVNLLNRDTIQVSAGGNKVILTRHPR